MTTTSIPNPVSIKGFARNKSLVPTPSDVYLDTSFLLDVYEPAKSLVQLGFKGLAKGYCHADCLAFLRETVRNNGMVYVSEHALNEAFRRIAVVGVDVLLVAPAGVQKWMRSSTTKPAPPNDSFGSWYKHQKAYAPAGFMRPITPLYRDLLAFIEQEYFNVVGANSMTRPLDKDLIAYADALDLEAPDAYHIALANCFPPCTAFATTDRDFPAIPHLQVYNWT